MKRIVILISGRGSNMQAILDAKLDAQVCAVISNNPAAGGLEVASRAGVATKVVNHRDFAGRAEFDRALGETIAGYDPDLVVLAGFLRILTADFIDRFQGRIMNIHPSLLPAFPGLETHRRALEHGVRLHGCTVHFVTAALDGGPIIVQAAVPVKTGDDEATLAARVLEQEHIVFPQAIRWFLDGKIKMVQDKVSIASGHAYPQAILSPVLG